MQLFIVIKVCIVLLQNPWLHTAAEAGIYVIITYTHVYACDYSI